MLPAAYPNTALISRNPSMIAAETSDLETIVLDVDHGIFLQLNRTAGRIWAMIESPVTIAALCTAIDRSFDVGTTDWRHEVFTFLAEMERRSLIVIVR